MRGALSLDRTRDVVAFIAAAGLVAAIPALIGYNQLASRIKGVRAELEDFALEFLNLAERNFT